MDYQNQFIEYANSPDANIFCKGLIIDRFREFCEKSINIKHPKTSPRDCNFINSYSILRYNLNHVKNEQNYIFAYKFIINIIKIINDDKETLQKLNNLDRNIILKITDCYLEIIYIIDRMKDYLYPKITNIDNNTYHFIDNNFDYFV